MKVLAMDIGGTNVRILASGQTERRKFPSGKDQTPARMVAGVEELAKGWAYDVVSIGYPGPVTRLPQGCRAGDDANAFIDGFRLWKDAKK